MKIDTIKNLLEDHPENVFEVDHKYVVKDTFGKIYKSNKKVLKKEGYQVKVLDLIDLNEESDHYNPLKYVKSESDAIILANRIARNTENEEAIIQNLKVALLSACFCYLKTERPKKEQNIMTVIKMLKTVAIDGAIDPCANSELDLIFYNLKKKNPDHVAVKHWDTFDILNRQYTWKYRLQAIISAITTLTIFDTAVVANVTSKDDLKLGKKGKIVYFVLVPTMDNIYDIFIDLLSCQLGMCNERYDKLVVDAAHNKSTIAPQNPKMETWDTLLKKNETQPEMDIWEAEK